MKFSKIKIIMFSALCISSEMLAFLHTNFSRPYDINWRMSEWKNKNFTFGIDTEYGRTSKCKNWNDDKVGALQIFNHSESGLAMLMGADRGSDINALANFFESPWVNATDDGVRGHFKLNGAYEELDLTLYGKYRLPLKTVPGNFDFYLYVPLCYKGISDVRWADQTKNVNNADLYVYNYLTNNIETVAKDLGNLELKSWNKFGLSDLVCFLSYYYDFKQMKEHLKNVRLTSRFGLSIPSGSEKNEDKVFSLPMGNDGAWGVPIALAIDLDFIYNIKAGLEFEMFFLSDVDRVRRLKTDVNQTDFLLLHKGKATKSFGSSWKFNLFLQAQRFFKGLSAMVAYQFLKHDDDKLTAQSNDFNYQIINSAESLKEWGTQNFVFKLNYDFFNECKNSWFKPQISFFYKLPVSGKRVINAQTFGGQIAFNF